MYEKTTPSADDTLACIKVASKFQGDNSQHHSRIEEEPELSPLVPSTIVLESERMRSTVSWSVELMSHKSSTQPLSSGVQRNSSQTSKI